MRNLSGKGLSLFFEQKDEESEERSSLLWPGKAVHVERNVKLVKALLYAVQVSYSFFIMYAQLLLHPGNSCKEK